MNTLSRTSLYWCLAHILKLFCSLLNLYHISDKGSWARRSDTPCWNENNLQVTEVALYSNIVLAFFRMWREVYYTPVKPCQHISGMFLAWCCLGKPWQMKCSPWQILSFHFSTIIVSLKTDVVVYRAFNDLTMKIPMTGSQEKFGLQLTFLKKTVFLSQLTSTWTDPHIRLTAMR